MDPEIKDRLDTLERKIDMTYRVADKTRKYILWTVIAGIVTLVLPLIGLAFVIPYFLQTLSSTYGGF
jgi:hypothetical protein